MVGVDAFSAINTRLEAATGCTSEPVVPLDGRPAIRPMMTLTLSSDHRVVDGARAAEFLRDVIEAIGNPGKWLG
jgi:pyruvate dehydrogenase E2 component (dihydrolipoyllysine-residue acetyltransferase)